MPRFRFNVDAVRKFHQIFPRFKRPQIKDVCEKPVKWKINEEKLWQTLCLGNKVIYFLPSFCRLQSLESEVSEDLLPPRKDGAPYTPFRQFVAPNGDGFPPTTSHGLTGCLAGWLPLLKVQLPQRSLGSTLNSFLPHARGASRSDTLAYT